MKYFLNSHVIVIIFLIEQEKLLIISTYIKVLRGKCVIIEMEHLRKLYMVDRDVKKKSKYQ